MIPEHARLGQHFAQQDCLSHSLRTAEAGDERVRRFVRRPLRGHLVTPIPEAMDFATAAAFPVVYGTAHFALTHRGHLAPGETLLVLGAAGGVGLATIEVGKMLGARVIAAARGADKLAVCRAHGADEGVDYAAEDLRDRVKELTDQAGVDVIFDPVAAGEFLNREIRLLAVDGTLWVSEHGARGGAEVNRIARGANYGWA